MSQNTAAPQSQPHQGTDLLVLHHHHQYDTSIFCLHVSHQNDVTVCYLCIVIFICMTSPSSAWVPSSLWCHCPLPGYCRHHPLPVRAHRQHDVTILCSPPASSQQYTRVVMGIAILCGRTQCGILTWSGGVATLIGHEGGGVAILIGCERGRLTVFLNTQWAITITQIHWDDRQNQHQEPHPDCGAVVLLVTMGSSQWPSA